MELTFDHITHGYEDNKPVLQDLELSITAGQFVALVGRSGCGKTTLLRLAAALLQPNSGNVRLDGQILHEPHDQIGVVFQKPVLLEWKTVLDNVLLPISLKRKIKPTDRQKALEILDLAGLAQHTQKYPAQLSGGQQSRAALARALMQKPKLLLLDEPFAALDAITREELQRDLLHYCRSSQLTILFITHDIQEAVYLADRVVVLKQGRISLDMPIQLAKPRPLTIKYEPQFNALCLQARMAMEEVE